MATSLIYLGQNAWMVYEYTKLYNIISNAYTVGTGTIQYSKYAIKGATYLLGYPSGHIKKHKRRKKELIIKKEAKLDEELDAIYDDYDSDEFDILNEDSDFNQNKQLIKTIKELEENMDHMTMKIRKRKMEIKKNKEKEKEQQLNHEIDAWIVVDDNKKNDECKKEDNGNDVKVILNIDNNFENDIENYNSKYFL
jgi:vacuolar-type H+-ATPase subunit I/STV1